MSPCVGHLIVPVPDALLTKRGGVSDIICIKERLSTHKYEKEFSWEQHFHMCALTGTRRLVGLKRRTTGTEGKNGEGAKKTEGLNLVGGTDSYC